MITNTEAARPGTLIRSFRSDVCLYSTPACTVHDLSDFVVGDCVKLYPGDMIKVVNFMAGIYPSIDSPPVYSNKGDIALVIASKIGGGDKAGVLVFRNGVMGYIDPTSWSVV